MEEWSYQPARDLNAAPADRLRHLRREGGLISLFFQWAWWMSVRASLRVLHRLEIHGRDNIPVEAPFIVVANHSSHLDVLSICSSLPVRQWPQMFPLAAGDTFFEKLPVATFAALCLNALPIWRKKCNPNDLSELRARLIEDRCIFVIFPEGTRTRTGKMGKFKRGVGIFAAGSSVPVVPAYIHGAFEALPPDRNFPRLSKVSITFGMPLVFEKIMPDGDGAKLVAATLEDAVRTLGGVPRVEV